MKDQLKVVLCFLDGFAFEWIRQPDISTACHSLNIMKMVTQAVMDIKYVLDFYFIRPISLQAQEFLLNNDVVLFDKRTEVVNKSQGFSTIIKKYLEISFIGYGDAPHLKNRDMEKSRLSQFIPGKLIQKLLKYGHGS